MTEITNNVKVWNTNTILKISTIILYAHSYHQNLYVDCRTMECETLKIPTCRTWCWWRPTRDEAGPDTSRCYCRFRAINRRRGRNSTRDFAVCLPLWSRCWATCRGWSGCQTSKTIRNNYELAVPALRSAYFASLARALRTVVGMITNTWRGGKHTDTIQLLIIW